MASTGLEILFLFLILQCALKASLTSEFRREAILSINTSAQMAFLAEEGFKPPGVGSDGVEYFPYSDNRFAAVAAALNGGNCLSRYRKGNKFRPEKLYCVQN